METHSDEEISEANARNLPATILALRVVDGRTYELMANGTLLLRKAIKFFEDRLRPRIDDANKLHKSLLADLKKDVDPINEALKYGNRQLSEYDMEQTRLAKVEQLWRETEAKRKDEEERLQLAELAQALGDKPLMEAILSAPNEAPPVVVAKDVPKVEGLSFREDWKYEITDWHQIPSWYHRMEQNPKGEWSCKCLKDIGVEVERLKQTCNIPGIRVYSVKVPIGRG